MVGQRRFGRIRQAAVVTSALALLLSGCNGEELADAPDSNSAQADDGGPPPAEPVTEDEPTTGDEPASAQAFVDAFEAEGLECTETDEDRWGPGVAAQTVCQGDDHVIMSIRNFENAGARDAQLDRIQALACEIADSGQDVQRVTTSDTWIIMAGGDRDVDFEVFGNAMSSLGLDWTDYICQ